MPYLLRFLKPLLGGAGMFVAACAAAADRKPADFAHDIAPILREHCTACHAGAKKEGAFSLNSRADLLAGGESGPAVVAGRSGQSRLIERIAATDADLRMPPEGKPVPPEQVAKLRAWIDAGLAWDEGFVFVRPAYEPPLRPRRVEPPPAVDGRTNPIDRILDADLAERKLSRPEPIDDATFARRAHLDLVGLLPTPQALRAFLADRSADKRARLIERLLHDDIAYAEHWLTFWNDLLRNDYAGTGFITGGRKQISRWLYDALMTNKPYDAMARELIAPPTPESAGFADGIRWRGDVSAGQTVEIQFAQSVGQSFLGINLKCASCHDSFIDRWKLDESYALAAVYSQRPLEIHRCDKPIGRTAQAGWLFPELGDVDPQASQPERLKQLAALLTHPQNGRFARTIVNRLWHRLMGRGIVHPTDAMQSEPWNADLLDFLAADLAEHGFDLKHVLTRIATSAAYQSRVQEVTAGLDDEGYVYAGPRAKRLTAEQFVDAVRQLTDTAPQRFDAPVLRGTVDRRALDGEQPVGRWIWAHADSAGSPGGERFTFRGRLTLKETPRQAVAVIAADNEFRLYVGGREVAAGNDWQHPTPIAIGPQLKSGANDLLITATNGGRGPNPAGLYCEIRLQMPDGSIRRFGTDDAWQWTRETPDARGRFVVGRGPEAREAKIDWQPAVGVSNDVWTAQVGGELRRALVQGSAGSDRMVRASLLKSDFLMRSLGRPNRDQIVSVRPAELTTLEAIDLSNGATLAEALARGAPRLIAAHGGDADALTTGIFEAALCRGPTEAERAAARELLGEKPSSTAVEDLLWGVLMLPEFQLVR